MGQILVIFGLLFLLVEPAQAIQTAGSSAVPKNRVIKPDPRVKTLKEFLDSYRSPLIDYAVLLVETADKYQIDWRWVPAIAGVESTFGKKIPANSFNAYGWNNGNYSFRSWEDSIEVVTATLKTKYVNRGLDTPYKIGPVYAPPSPFWPRKVVYFMNQIEAFAKENETA